MKELTSECASFCIVRLLFVYTRHLPVGSNPTGKSQHARQFHYQASFFNALVECVSVCFDWAMISLQKTILNRWNLQLLSRLCVRMCAWKTILLLFDSALEATCSELRVSCTKVRVVSFSGPRYDASTDLAEFVYTILPTRKTIVAV